MQIQPLLPTPLSHLLNACSGSQATKATACKAVNRGFDSHPELQAHTLNIPLSRFHSQNFTPNIAASPNG
jgi:hypothetical protein